MSKPPRRRKALSPDDISLWRHVAQSVTPLDPRRALPEEAETPENPVPDPQKPAFPILPAKSGAKKPALPPIAPIERRLRQALVRGREEAGARLDLHGHTQDAAHRALHAFLRRSQAQGHKLVIVITGKGSARAPHRDDGYHPHPGHERGVLKRMVPLWLGLPEFRAMVLGFESAHAFHGGEGALYVRLRKLRG